MIRLMKLDTVYQVLINYKGFFYLLKLFNMYFIDKHDNI